MVIGYTSDDYCDKEYRDILNSHIKAIDEARLTL